MKKHMLVANFRHPRFVAILPEKQNLAVEDLTTDLWRYPASVMTSATFENFNPIDSQREYNGSITIKNMAFEVPEGDYEATRRVNVIDMISHRICLPTARLRAEVTIEDLDQTVVNTLQWYANLTRDFDARTVCSQTVNVIDRLLKALIESPEQLSKILLQYQQQEKRFRFLTRKAQEDPTRLSTDVLLIEKPIDSFGVGQSLLIALSEIMGDETDTSKEEAIDFLQKMKSNLSALPIPADDESQDLGVELRLRKSFAIQSVLKEVRNSQKELPDDVDPKAAEQFASDFFHLLMSFWNRVVRYFKYEESQHWINEYPPHAKGLFYVRNRVTLDDNEILPHVTAHVQQDVLRLHLLDRSKWDGALSSTADGNHLQEYEMDWTVDGILSQALSHLTKDELLASVILSGVALEEAMTRGLYHVDPQHCEQGGLGLKSRKVMDGIGRENLGYDESSWNNDWQLLISGNKETGKGLIQIRTRLQHPEVGVAKSIPGRAEVAERVLAAQRMCRSLLKWERQQRGL